MALDVAAVQAALAGDGLDGWLLYDFRGLNPIAADLTGVARHPGHLLTRRWFYLIPRTGEPRGLAHAIEPQALSHLPGRCDYYAARTDLEAGLGRVLAGVRSIAMEYSPEAAVPTLGRVDAGTIELVRRYAPQVVSSGDLVQRFAAVWNADAEATHVAASNKLYRIKDQAFDAIARRIGDRVATTEYDIQRLMTGWFADEGLISDSEANVSAGANAGNPHYVPTAVNSRAIGAEELILLDLWGKLDRPGAVFADITWVGFTGRGQDIPKAASLAFAAVCDARDAAVDRVQQAVVARRPLRGWEVDRAASRVLHDLGYGRHILHRTGHSLGESVHGNGVNMDDYETHDERRLLPGTGFTIEPGLYFDEFGVRSEIDMVVHADEATITGPRQTEILALG